MQWRFWGFHFFSFGGGALGWRHFHLGGHTWVAPRILRWDTKQDSQAEQAKKIVPPLFQMWGTSKQIYVRDRNSGNFGF